ncbi:4-carboxy-4-hydroxy-2-oxoadipate aldolase/oxaloacetate decarboxylase [Hyphococcus luteus]|uniref:4-hydroxy-4-methyl-2-oxoglutarate aldolase n=1 Tax=Hyphococcus luteus TaxID=2058213 RepID=A0A2S7K564_9PROT|nr:4-carboxy-4-hydroxy-2-oxoadipate aldolase/oxaloacetate decarboxylase [Marinicaulis flavus]PQA87643.1 4-carboxy-4-hydroxy-2-oxoadipate aldolase/oxaloacetate decarboxylase [Marinicaulis flavus]
MSIVVQNIRRPAPAQIERIGRFGVATIHEAQGRTGLMAPYMRPVYSGTRIAGPAVTVTVPPCDNWMIHVAIEECAPGDILVVSPSSDCDDGYFGELLARSLIAHGVKALIINAGVRDTAELKEIAFPVWSKCISAQGTVKETLGAVNMPIVCAGALVKPGDVVIADDDGVCIVDIDRVDEIANLSEAREKKEAQMRRRLCAGEKSLDLFNLREKLKAKEIRYISQKDLP